MEQPKIEIDEELIPASQLLDEEDALDLIYECHALLVRILDRSSNPKWLLTDGLKMISKLEATLSWHKLH